jgi:methionine-rich copper-binding protein CopC
MKIIKIAALGLLAAAAMSQAPAWAHAALEHATPAKDAQLTSAPAAIILKFNEKLEPSFSAIKITDSAGHAVTSDKATLDVADARTLHAQLPALKPGVYTVKWVAVGHDGHRRNGSYQFAVK